MKKKLRITEGDLHRIIEGALNELDIETYASAARKRAMQGGGVRKADALINHGLDQERKKRQRDGENHDWRTYADKIVNHITESVIKKLVNEIGDTQRGREFIGRAVGMNAAKYNNDDSHSRKATQPSRVMFNLKKKYDYPTYGDRNFRRLKDIEDTAEDTYINNIDWENF